MCDHLAAQGTEERSQALNEAYAALTEMSAVELRSYERELRLRGPPGSTLKCASSHIRGLCRAHTSASSNPRWQPTLLFTDQSSACQEQLTHHVENRSSRGRGA